MRKYFKGAPRAAIALSLAIGFFLAPLSAQEGKRYAVLVGVNEYMDSGILSLVTPRNDAKDLAAKLANDWDRVFTMTDDQNMRSPDLPTRSNIERRVRLLADLCKPSDTVLLFFSGHGIVDNDLEYFIPLDADVSRLTDTSVSVKGLLSSLKANGITRVILAMDACRESVTKTKGIGLVSRRELSRVDSSDPITIYSTKPGWFSYEDDKGRNGIFTRFLLEGLSGKADSAGDGTVSLGELSQWLPDAVADYALAKGIRQKPSVASGRSDLDGLSLVSGLPITKAQPKPSPKALAKSDKGLATQDQIQASPAGKRDDGAQLVQLYNDKLALGRSEAKANHQDGALKAYGEAIETAYKLPSVIYAGEAVSEMGGILDKSGRSIEALSVYDRFIATYPEDGWIVNLAATICIFTNQFDKGRQYLSKVSSSNPWGMDLDAILAYRQGNWDEAVAKAQKASLADPDASDPNYYLAVDCVRKRDYDKAIAYLSKAESNFRKYSMPDMANLCKNQRVALEGIKAGTLIHPESLKPSSAIASLMANTQYSRKYYTDFPKGKLGEFSKGGDNIKIQVSDKGLIMQGVSKDSSPLGRWDVLSPKSVHLMRVRLIGAPQFSFGTGTSWDTPDFQKVYINYFSYPLEIKPACLSGPAKSIKYAAYDWDVPGAMVKPDQECLLVLRLSNKRVISLDLYDAEGYVSSFTSKLPPLKKNASVEISCENGSIKLLEYAEFRVN